MYWFTLSCIDNTIVFLLFSTHHTFMYFHVHSFHFFFLLLMSWFIVCHTVLIHKIIDSIVHVAFILFMAMPAIHTHAHSVHSFFSSFCRLHLMSDMIIIYYCILIDKNIVTFIKKKCWYVLHF
jgi:hypothetical protein